MNVLFCKKQMILLVMGIGLCAGAHGFSVKHTVKKTLTSMDRVTAPFSHNMGCYTECNQKVGRQGGDAFQDLVRLQNKKDALQILRFLHDQQKPSLPKIDSHLAKALGCLTECGAALTVRFLAQLLGSIKDEEVVRAVGILLGLTYYKEGKFLSRAYLATENGHESRLFGVVFKKAFHRGCLRVLRHEKDKRIQFRKNLDILRQVFFEMYGPVRKAEEYSRHLII